MSDEIKHECAVALVVLRKDVEHYRQKYATGDYGGVKLSLLLEKQHNRGQDGAGVAILSDHPRPGEPPYWIAKSASATPLADVLEMLTKRSNVQTGLTGLTGLSGGTPPAFQNPVNLVNPVKNRFERVFLGHLRYATFGKNNVMFCHPFLHESSELAHTVLLAGNFNLTNAAELFEDYSQHGSFPTSKADGYLICELIAKELGGTRSGASAGLGGTRSGASADGTKPVPPIASALSSALANADGAWTLCGMTGDGWAFATRDAHGIRPGFYYIDDDVAVVESERPAIQAAFDVPPEAVKELPPGCALIVSPAGELSLSPLNPQLSTPNSKPGTRNPEPGTLNSKLTTLNSQLSTPCSFERIYFSRANDADIHRERKALGAALVPQILKAANAPIDDIFFSYIPNSARIAFHGLLEELFSNVFSTGLTGLTGLSGGESPALRNPVNLVNPVKKVPRFGEIAVKDAKFRTFIADAAARREFYKHVYDVTYGLVRPGKDTLVVLDDSIVRGNTMKNAILPMLDRLGPKRIVIASSAPPIRYPDCYGIDMSTLGELVAFRALVNLLGDNAENTLTQTLKLSNSQTLKLSNPLAPLYARFTEEQHCREIARLLTPPGMKAEVVVVYQTVENLRLCLIGSTINSKLETLNSKLTTHNSKLSIGDWYFTGDYPTPGGYKVLHKALANYLARKTDRSY